MLVGGYLSHPPNWGTGNIQDKEKIAAAVYDIAYGLSADRAPLPAFPSGESQVTDAAGAGKVVPILMYHHIGDYKGPKPKDAYLYTPADTFREETGWLASHGYHTITLPELFSGYIPANPIVLTFDDGYQDNYDNAYKILREKGQKGTFFVISGFVGGGYLSNTEVKEMSNGGMDIESHTVSHPELAKLSPASLTEQLMKSKQVLEDLTGKKVDFLAYPFGNYNDSIKNATKAAGYKAAVTVSPLSKNESMYELPRIEAIPRDRGNSLGNKIAGYIKANGGFAWKYR